MTDLVAKAREVLDGVTPGPWSVKQIKGHCVDYIITDHPDHQGPQHENYVGETGLGAGQKGPQRFEQDARFIVFARWWVPAAADQIEALEAENARLRAALVDHNDLLRSSNEIAKREGIAGMVASTNWDAFYNRVAVVLKRHHETTNAARAAEGGSHE